MTQKWINDFNKKCAEFLDWKFEEDDLIFSFDKKNSFEFLNRPAYAIYDLKFHSDWNWIMEVFEYILELPKKYDGNFWELNGKVFSIKHMMFHEIIGEKETVIQKIDNFIDWYNKQKAVGNETVKKDS